VRGRRAGRRHGSTSIQRARAARVRKGGLSDDVRPGRYAVGPGRPHGVLAVTRAVAFAIAACPCRRSRRQKPRAAGVQPQTSLVMHQTMIRFAVVAGLALMTGRATADGPLSAPSGLSATVQSPHEIRLSWDSSSGASSYVVLRDNDGSGYSFRGLETT